MFALLSYDFMRRALEAGLVLSLVAPTIGIFFVVRRYSAMADTLAHVSLAGVAAGLFFGISSVWSAMIACVVAILGIERIREQRTLASDTVVSLFLFGGLALGVVLLGLRRSAGINIASFLFGSVLTVTGNEVLQIAGLGAAVLVITLLLWEPFFAVSLDEEVAEAAGLPVRNLNRLLAVLGAATIAISIHVVGVLLIGALMVIPVLAAMQFRAGFRSTWAIAVAVSALSTVSGLALSYYLDLASGATVVLCAVALFLVSGAAARLTGAGTSKKVAK
ncbi:MAG TPA: metal ABC transporter permease [Candidatus Eisenbacteria bacterium]|jgi:zinc transport system permease protein|nr:metal ABC transporter permease [Candidatus Eisenbacteria bacterium]